MALFAVSFSYVSPISAPLIFSVALPAGTE